MQKVIVVDIDDEKQERAEQKKAFTDRVVDYIKAEGLKVEVFDSPLEAFADQEGPYRVNQLIEDDHMVRPENEDLLKEMGLSATIEIESNLLMHDGDYGSILDNDTLEQIAIDKALSVFEKHFDELSDHDREIAKAFIEEWGEDEE